MEASGNSPSQLTNGHFADDSFLTLTENEQNVQETLCCVDIFCLASGTSIQWYKTQRYGQPFLSAPSWPLQFDWKWLDHGEVFRFLGIPFAFSGFSSGFVEYGPYQNWEKVVLLDHKAPFSC